MAPATMPPDKQQGAQRKVADNITRLNLSVDRLLPLHGRIVPLAELNRAIGRSN
jgi:hypothetical protein